MVVSVQAGWWTHVMPVVRVRWAMVSPVWMVLLQALQVVVCRALMGVSEHGFVRGL